MGEYRLVIGIADVSEVFTAVDDAAAVATARARVGVLERYERSFTVQRNDGAAWADVTTWMPRPLGRVHVVESGTAAPVPAEDSTRPTPRGVSLAFCCSVGDAVFPDPCPHHGRQVPADVG